MLGGPEITFLFTDIEGSSSMWEHHPAEMPAAIALHDAIIRRAAGWVETNSPDSGNRGTRWTPGPPSRMHSASHPGCADHGVCFAGPATVAVSLTRS